MTKKPKKKEFKQEPNVGILKAIELAGGQIKLAEMMQVAQPAIHHWLYYSCPAVRAKEIEEKLGVPRKQICPQIFE